MIDFSNRDSVFRVIHYGINNEYDHLLEELYTKYGEPDPDEVDCTHDFCGMEEEELFQFCIKHDFDHIWLDYFIVQQLITDQKDVELNS